MPSFTNLELQQQIMPTLEELKRLRLPFSGAFLLRTIIRDITQHLRDVEELRQAALKDYALMDGGDFAVKSGPDGKPLIGRDAWGNPTSIVAFKDDEAEKQFALFYRELMTQKYECAGGIRKRDLMDDRHPWDSPAALIVNLGDLLIIDDDDADVNSS